MALYQPTHAEIALALDASGVRLPELQHRMEIAGRLLANETLYWKGSSWYSLMGDAFSDYRPSCAVNFRRCSCIDHEARLATIGGVSFCKHKLALLALRQICIAHLNARVVGSYHYPPAREAARRHANAALLSFTMSVSAPPSIWTWADAADAGPQMLCDVTITPHGLAPADEFALWVIADWLGQAQPLPPGSAAQPWPICPLAPLAA